MSALDQVLPAPAQRPAHDGARSFRHVPALDGLRGVAVLCVVLFHFLRHKQFGGGWVGVDAFFVLSGFLITSLLTTELRRTGRFAFGQFLVRRALRLVPALAFLLCVWVGVLVVAHDRAWLGMTPARSVGQPVDLLPALGDVLASLGFVANWDVLQGGMEAPLEHLWSLAVEGQFYLLWPLLALFLLRLPTGKRLGLTAVLALGAALLPFIYWNGGAGAERIYFGTDTRAVELLGGALAAWVWQAGFPRSDRGRLAVRAGGWIGLLAVLVIAVSPPSQRPKSLLSATVLAVLVGVLVVSLLQPRHRLTRVLETRPLLWAGRRSYALYLWNYVLATWTHPLPLVVSLAIGIPASMALSEVSWRLVERPALAWAKKPAART
jgi:peptidoglycan/LPS O-acetylase OafA/YrhL